MGDKCKQKKSESVFVQVFCFVVTLGNEIAHYGAGESSDDVEQKGEGFGGIARKQHPGDMVKCHSGNGYEFYCVGIQCFFQVFHRRFEKTKVLKAFGPYYRFESGFFFF